MTIGEILQAAAHQQVPTTSPNGASGRGTVELALLPDHPFLDDCFTAYVSAALYASTDDAGRPLDDSYDRKDLPEELLLEMREDCRQFMRRADDLAGCTADDAFLAGRHFWLTRNGEGSGFWSGDWQDGPAIQLTKLSKGFGHFTLYVGDDCKIYGMKG